MVYEAHHEGEIEWTLPVDERRGLKGRMVMGTGRIRWWESVLGETTGIWGHLSAELETWNNGNSQESMRVTLAKTPSNRGYGA